MIIWLEIMDCSEQNSKHWLKINNVEGTLRDANASRGGHAEVALGPGLAALLGAASSSSEPTELSQSSQRAQGMSSHVLTVFFAPWKRHG